MKKVKIAVQLRDGESGRILKPVDGTRGKLKPFKINQILSCDITGTIDPRSLAQLRLFFRLAETVKQNSHFPRVEDVVEHIKRKCHYVDEFINHNGIIEYRTKSISFENCDQPEFNDFMENAIPAMADTLGCTEEELINSQYDVE